MAERTGAGDPLRVIPLLWRRGVKTGRSGLTLEAIVDGAVALADTTGVDQLSMRKLAERLGVGAMTLYSHVPGKAELIDLMVDRVFADVTYPAPTTDPGRWRGGLETVAERNWELLGRHRWLIHVDTARPPLGPGTIAKYDAELQPLVDTGLTDVQIDQALTLILEHVRSSARLAFATAAPPTATAGDGAADSREASDLEWWHQAGPVLAGLLDTGDYPYAARIGNAAGQEYNAPGDPHRAYLFGLQTILDGIEALIARQRDERDAGQAG
ncbi:TetR/AcrR family transcriptional regulator [Pseudactinotalea sp. Z1732]|uniref:TetR/AcrR family transcriptional regulator n=1 Tax=Micrococcales TaxID=85006 RepID=UPI003C7A33B4